MAEKLKEDGATVIFISINQKFAGLKRSFNTLSLLQHALERRAI
ncbi:MAG: hypothetical protein RLZZ613_1950 [Pseudomonadota bacterium]